MMGFAGSDCTSRMGPSVAWIPTARASTAVARPAARARFSSFAAPKAIAGGMWVPPGRRRIPGPVSRSEMTRSGTRARSCAAFSLAAMAAGCRWR
jgi:hypothetical protein